MVLKVGTKFNPIKSRPNPIQRKRSVSNTLQSKELLPKYNRQQERLSCTRRLGFLFMTWHQALSTQYFVPPGAKHCVLQNTWHKPIQSKRRFDTLRRSKEAPAAEEAHEEEELPAQDVSPRGRQRTRKARAQDSAPRRRQKKREVVPALGLSESDVEEWPKGVTRLFRLRPTIEVSYKALLRTPSIRK